jgi:WhiB family redox-sensing transcriptional regulator
MSLDWMSLAACRDMDPDVFFPTGVGVAGQRQVAAAERICRTCPVQEQCGEQRVRTGASTGVWGGKYRNLKDPAATRVVSPIIHGTNAGYNKHLDRGQEPCHQCREAHKYHNRKSARR